MLVATTTKQKKSRLLSKRMIVRKRMLPKESWNEQLAKYFGKVDLDVNIEALRTR